MSAQLGRLEPLDPRGVWLREAHDFTPWLLANSDALAGVLGIDLELSAAEHPVGGFSLDLVGRDLTNNCVLIVENQLTATDHGHLGQVLTYAAGTNAGTVVWMATGFREEHRQALDYLNDLGGEDVRFFGVEITVVRIGPSEPAPLFKLRAQPNDWHAEVAAAAKTTSKQAGKAPLYQAFWARFLERVKAERPGWTNAQKPQTANWFSMACPFKGGPYYSASFAQGGKLRTELYIDFGDADANAALFQALLGQKDQVARERPFLAGVGSVVVVGSNDPVTGGRVQVREHDRRSEEEGPCAVEVHRHRRRSRVWIAGLIAARTKSAKDMSRL